MTSCITPGCCTCPNMKRCSSCGYTKHDEMFHLDHYICDQSQSRRQSLKKQIEDIFKWTK